MNSKTKEFIFRLWGYSCLLCLGSLISIPVEDCITYPVHPGWLGILTVTLGVLLGIVLIKIKNK